MKRVRIEEFFRDFDKLRKGKVTGPQFKSILSQLNFNLTDEEYFRANFPNLFGSAIVLPELPRHYQAKFSYKF